MLRNYIERREKSFHGRDTNRKSLPFEWGLEHLGLDRNGNSPTALRDFVSAALIDSPSFYACEPAADYAFDGEIVKFSSALQTPYPENNTVWGRFFDAGKDVAMVVLPQWNCKWDDGHITLCRVLQRAGISSLRLSLPYHHYRRHAHLERSEYLVSPGVGRTLHHTRPAVSRRRGRSSATSFSVVADQSVSIHQAPSWFEAENARAVLSLRPDFSAGAFGAGLPGIRSLRPSLRACLASMRSLHSGSISVQRYSGLSHCAFSLFGLTSDRRRSTNLLKKPDSTFAGPKVFPPSSWMIRAAIATHSSQM